MSFASNHDHDIFPYTDADDFYMDSDRLLNKQLDIEVNKLETMVKCLENLVTRS